MRKILFLDIDGVLNSTKFFESNSMKCSKDDHIDLGAVVILKRILNKTNAKVVLSSSWRGHEDNHKIIKENVCDFIDITPRCCEGIRGVEIYKWINKNYKWEERKKLKYAILDDDSDMLLWQKDSFFHVDHKVGLTEEIADEVIKHLNS